MANIQLESLSSAATPLTDSIQYLEISQNGVTKKLLLADLWTWVAGKGQIETLPSATTPLTDGTQYLNVSQGGITKKILLADFWTWIASKAQIEAQPSATTPLTDSTQYLDVSQGGVTKKILLSDFWTWVAGKIAAASIVPVPAFSSGAAQWWLRLNAAATALEFANQGVLNMPVRTVTASTTLAVTDEYVRVDTTAGAVTLTLPLASSCIGHAFWFKRLNATTAITLTVTSGSGNTFLDTFAGAASGGTSITLGTTQYVLQKIRAVSATLWEVS